MTTEYTDKLARLLETAELVRDIRGVLPSDPFHDGKVWTEEEHGLDGKTGEIAGSLESLAREMVRANLSPGAVLDEEWEREITDSTRARLRSLVGRAQEIARAAGAALTRFEYEGEGETRCPECGGLNGAHGLVHERHDSGGGGVNRPCSRAAAEGAE